MPDVTVERRSAPRHAMVLAAEVVELPRGTKLNARTADISWIDYYIDTLNLILPGSEVRVRIIHNEECFVAVARVVYVSYGLGMGIAFTKVEEDELARLGRWLFEASREN